MRLLWLRSSLHPILSGGGASGRNSGKQDVRAVRDFEGRREILDLINKLEPEVFENLIFDCAVASGLRNVVWRTPGADGGRDIEGQSSHIDISGYETTTKFYVECKRYSSSLTWPLVWEKIAHADVQGADVLLIATNSQPSPACESEVAKWNAGRRRPIVRFWRGYQLPALIRVHPHVAVSYGLASPGSASEASLMPLALMVSKITQSAYTTLSIGSDVQGHLEASAALSELLSQRLEDVHRHSRIVPAALSDKMPQYDWLDARGDASGWEEVGLRALLVTVRYVTGMSKLELDVADRTATVKLVSPNIPLSTSGLREIQTVSHWSRAEFDPRMLSEGKVVFRQR